MRPYDQQWLPATIWPGGSTPVIANSGNQANANCVATLPGASGVTTYLCGFFMLGSGSTLGLVVNATVAGLVGGTITFPYAGLTGLLVLSPPLIANFAPPLPASAPNTPIVVTLPALGLGNTNASVFAWGFQL